MNNPIYTFALTPDWKLISELSRIDRFGGSWMSIEKREGQSLKELKQIATVRSVGASTRIEGAKMNDDEVAVLIQNLDSSKLEERDQQEVIGYFEALDIITESFRDIEITESNIKHLHNMLMRYSKKDEWHKGNYKQHSNVVEASNADGSKYVVFKTTEPGFVTEQAMSNLVAWYRADTETHPIVRAALFVYDFLSIHPFQDGNGRLSRLLGTLLLLRHGYSWLQYVSFEHEIEARKTEYYKILMQCQRQRPGEDVYPWVAFFLDCLGNIQEQLMAKLEAHGKVAGMSPREKKMYVFIENHPGSKSGVIAERLAIPLPTVKRILADMVAGKFLAKYGTGAGTNYVVEEVPAIKKDNAFRLADSERKMVFTFAAARSFMELKKIILTPLFDWQSPDEWAARLANEGLYIRVECKTGKGNTVLSQPFLIATYNTPFNYKPAFTIPNPISIPADMFGSRLNASDYPITATIELCGAVPRFGFDVMVVYDSVD